MVEITERDVLQLEVQVIALTNKLTHFNAGAMTGSALPVSRDYLGTLHVNLCQLIRRAERMRDDLELAHDFRR